MKKTEIINSIRRNILDQNKFGVEKIALFGSFARKDQNSESDIDVMVKFKENQKTFDNYMDLKIFLEDEFQGFKVDLVVEESIKKRIKPFIYKNISYVS